MNEHLQVGRFTFDLSDRPVRCGLHGDVIVERRCATCDSERHPWSEQDEMLRQGYKDAGLEPRLFHWWKSSTTASLVASRDEFAGEPDLADVVRDLNTEIAYRTL